MEHASVACHLAGSDVRFWGNGNEVENAPRTACRMATTSAGTDGAGLLGPSTVDAGGDLLQEWSKIMILEGLLTRDDSELVE